MMGKFAVYLSLALLYTTSTVYGVGISDIITVQGGSTNGGCDDRLAILDGPNTGWLQDAIDTADQALTAIDMYNNDDGTGERVRKAMLTFFGIKDEIPEGAENDSTRLKRDVTTIRNRIQRVLNWFNGVGQPAKAGAILFCDSTFLVQKQPTDTAQDFTGLDIQVDGKDVTINQVPGYARRLTGNNVPWWSGDRADFNGYYITSAESGGNYCNGEHYGLTSTLEELELRQPRRPGQPARPAVRTTINNVVLCPYAFDKPDTPSLYRDVFSPTALIQEGTSLAEVVPLSATFLHEAFHVVWKTSFLQGDAEVYGLAECIELAGINAVSSRQNPENYVYFIAAMYYLTGPTVDPPTDDVPLARNWDFCNGADSAKDPDAMDTDSD